ncbi:MAG: putative membrane protein YeiH [Flavobacteriales bacterium]|jgi:uncharacterized membrane protein YeiH
MGIIFYFDIVGVFLFSLSGTLTAQRYNKLDYFGLAFVALITAVGGGTVRDVIIDAHPIAWVSHSAYFVAIVSGYLAALIFKIPILKFTKPIVTIDAVAVGFAAIAGMQKSIEYGANPLAAIVFGLITATVGGVIRDVICNEIPMVLRREVYASAVLLGCVVYLALTQILPSCESISLWSGVLVIVAVRLLAVHYRWNLDKRALDRRKRAIKNNTKRIRKNGRMHLK